MADRRSARGLAAAAAGAAVVSLLPILLRQLGIVRHLPDPPLTMFDSDGITGSKSAYPLQIPDSALGIVSYGVSFALLMHSSPSGLWQKTTNAKLVLDAGMAVFNSCRQVVVFRKVCGWCLLPVLATAIMVPAGWQSREDQSH